MAGNANSGRRQEKPFRDAMMVEIKAAGDNHKLLREIACVVLEECRGGNMEAIKFMAERVDGKVAQPIAGDTDNPLVISNIIRTIVDPIGLENSAGVLSAAETSEI
jgi:hypothetical protein